MLIDFIRQIHAAKNFSIKDNFDFIALDDISAEEIQKAQTAPEIIEIWAAVKIYFDGEIPESYKVLNLLIGDWVENNIQSLSKVIHEQLKQHFLENYPNSDASDLDTLDESAIWTDQLDYMPTIDSDNNSMTIEIELVLDAEPLE